jgi:hypothetical protein
VGARRRLIIGTAIAMTIAIGPAGCKRKDAPSPPAPRLTDSNADHLAKGEIPEGKERAFTLPLPLHSTIKARFTDSVHVASAHTLEELASFTRARVKDGSASSGASETRFENVVAKGDPTRKLTIEIRSAPISGEFRSQMVVSDVTPLPVNPSETDADRWRKAGMTPDGQLLDPKHMH